MLFRSERFDPLVLDGTERTSRSLFDYFSESTRENFFQHAIPELWKTGRWTGEVEGIGTDGSTVPLWQSAIAHIGSDGKPAFFSGIAHDMTAIKAADERHRVSEERLRAIVAEGSDVILILTGAGQITYASPSVQRVLGYDPEALIGTIAFDLIHADDQKMVLVRFASLTTEGVPSTGSCFRVRDAIQTWRWVEAITTNHLSTPGIHGYIVNARDISARHEANEELARGASLLASVMGAAASEAIFVTDATATIVAFSRGADMMMSP